MSARCLCISKESNITNKSPRFRQNHNEGSWDLNTKKIRRKSESQNLERRSHTKYCLCSVLYCALHFSCSIVPNSLFLNSSLLYSISLHKPAAQYYSSPSVKIIE